MERRKKKLVWVLKRVRVFTLRILEINYLTQNDITFVTAQRPKTFGSYHPGIALSFSSCMEVKGEVGEMHGQQA